MIRTSQTSANKAALCFIISYDHSLAKEEVWREWIRPNEDVVNVYFYYKDFRKIRSDWVRAHALPANYAAFRTSYFHVVPAYLSLLQFAHSHDSGNAWFCMLTAACCPVVPPSYFRAMLAAHGQQSVFAWRPAWWNPRVQLRANLAKLPPELWLGHDPWFVLSRSKVEDVQRFLRAAPATDANAVLTTVCAGGLANESVFAILFRLAGTLDTDVVCASSHVTDWTRPSSVTSPRVFRTGDADELACIDAALAANRFAFFVRKIAPSFPDARLREYTREQPTPRERERERERDPGVKDEARGRCPVGFDRPRFWILVLIVGIVLRCVYEYECMSCAK